MTAVFDAAVAAHDAGLCVVPPKEDGSKRPDGSWKAYQTERPDAGTLENWYANGRAGVGVVCGAVSGNLEMLEFEGLARKDGVFKQFVEAASGAGLRELLDRITAGYVETTPSGGIHFLYRCEQIEGNQKLASRPATPEELAVKPDDRYKVLIETRGEGGYVIVAPSGETVHPDGTEWKLVGGGFTSIVTITPDERDALFTLARTFDRIPPIETMAFPLIVKRDGEDTRPGTEYNERANWAEILEPKGWRRIGKVGDEALWRRPGKDRGGHSATTNFMGSDVLKVFSTSVGPPFEAQKTYTKFHAYTLLYHGGDWGAAAKQLVADGYGGAGVGYGSVYNLIGQSGPTAGGQQPAPAGINQSADADEQPADTPPAVEPAVRPFFVNWSAFWAEEPDDNHWLYEPIIAKGRGHAIYAGAKTGKSLIVLWILAQLATDEEPIVVVYLDYEMSPEDLRERLEDMGYGPDSDLSRLYYALLPSLPPLDTAAGGNALIEIVKEVAARRPDYHVVVCIDTLSRALEKEEDKADTIRAFYRETGMKLKQAGVTWLRLDHAGKDKEKGQRGSSAKSDDVDVVWRLEKSQDGLMFTREVARMGWVPEKFNFKVTPVSEPFKVVPALTGVPEGTVACVAELDRLDVPLDSSVRKAALALKVGEVKVRTSVLAAALKSRRERAEREFAGVLPDSPGNTGQHRETVLPDKCYPTPPLGGSETVPAGKRETVGNDAPEFFESTTPNRFANLDEDLFD